MHMNAPHHVLVGYDGSPLSELALHRAFRLVEHASFALIHVVSVVEEAPGDRLRLASGEVMSRWAALDSVRLMVAGVTKDLRSRYPQARVIAHLRTGSVAQSLVDFAYRFHIDQIIVGARGQGEHCVTCLGSVASSILGLTEIPIHIESPLLSVPAMVRSQALRWAYISDGKPETPMYLTHAKERARA
jgi:nucleotide-binding universal stress UspA family protein